MVDLENRMIGHIW